MAITQYRQQISASYSRGVVPGKVRSRAPILIVVSLISSKAAQLAQAKVVLLLEKQLRDRDEAVSPTDASRALANRNLLRIA
jgi:hypothetical protein|tara:strand:- start:10242 stop:10487 length:246 start_codon:yes stop_codon:yes gene_type:complete